MSHDFLAAAGTRITTGVWSPSSCHRFVSSVWAGQSIANGHAPLKEMLVLYLIGHCHSDAKILQWHGGQTLRQGGNHHVRV